MFQLRKATRQKTKLKVGLAGPSGSGKTYSALLLASGMADWSKVAMIDTENGSGELYAHLGDYNVITLDAPYSPERYVQAIKACEDAGMEVIVIDSVSQEWEGEGGCLDIHGRMPGNSFANWAKVTPRHTAFINAITQSKCHVITTVRKKQDYDMTQSNGKTTVTKVGLKEITREGFSYEVSLNFTIDIAHMATADKDRTGLFMDKPEFMITPETGKTLLDWCNSGVEPIKQEKTIEKKVYEAEKPAPEVVYPTPEQVARFTEVFAAYGTQEKMSADAVKAAKKKMFNGKKIKDTPVETVLKYTRMMENKLQSNTK